MATREEIREEVAERIFDWCKRNGYLAASFEWKELRGGTRGLILAITDIILEYEHSQGVVIKVDRELPDSPWARNADEGFTEDIILTRGYYSAQQDMCKAGYVAVEPLVKK